MAYTRGNWQREGHGEFSCTELLDLVRSQKRPDWVGNLNRFEHRWKRYGAAAMAFWLASHRRTERPPWAFQRFGRPDGFDSPMPAETVVPQDRLETRAAAERH